MIIDISPAVFENCKVWPGDVVPKRINTLQMKHGDNINLTGITTTMHLGAHTDAPKHFKEGELSIGEVPLDAYFGDCQVITVPVKPGQRICVNDIKTPITAPRILFRTNTFNDPSGWTEDFAALSTEAVEYLAAHEVVLVGIDTPSVDLFHAKVLAAHKACLENKIAILESIVLTEVTDGQYQLIALPLKLIGFDASPVRAILVKD